MLSMATLKLGIVDQNSMPANKKQFLSSFHSGMADSLQQLQQFRDESTWRPFTQMSGNSVRDLQQFLKDAGFMPKATMDGIFGYSTQSAVRLFQEYLRSIEGDATIGVPDGIVGPNTWAHIETWKKNKKAENPEFVCQWGQISSQKPTPEFSKWIDLLNQAKNHFISVKDSHPIVKLVENYNRPTDTKKVGDWDTSPNTIHLIGIRRNQEKAVQNQRENDDLFILLINGMVFKFWGSTDPNPGMSDRSEIPFLVESQHEYQFGWHKLSDMNKVYQALRPASAGVLVFRDKDMDRALTEKDIARGFDPAGPNTTINIHWSGVGSTNFSAGCQVIAGNAYQDHNGVLRNCSSFAARNQGDLANSGKTRGAYNVFADLIISYGPPGVRTIRYMLGRDETFSNFPAWDASFVAADVELMRSGGSGMS